MGAICLAFSSQQDKEKGEEYCADYLKKIKNRDTNWKQNKENTNIESVRRHIKEDRVMDTTAMLPC